MSRNVKGVDSGIVEGRMMRASRRKGYLVTFLLAIASLIAAELLAGAIVPLHLEKGVIVSGETAVLLIRREHWHSYVSCALFLLICSASECWFQRRCRRRHVLQLVK